MSVVWSGRKASKEGGGGQGISGRKVWRGVSGGDMFNQPEELRRIQSKRSNGKSHQRGGDPYQGGCCDKSEEITFTEILGKAPRQRRSTTSLKKKEIVRVGV